MRWRQNTNTAMPTSIELRQQAGAALDKWKAAMADRDGAKPEEREAKSAAIAAAKAEHERLMGEVRDQEALEAAEKSAAANHLSDQDRRGGENLSPEQKARQRFSVLRAIRLSAEKRQLDGIELEMYQEANKEAGESKVSLTGDVRIPSFLMRSEKRDLTATGSSGAEGGYTIATDLRGHIDILVPRLALESLGATKLTGLVGNVDISRQITKASTAWEGENTAADETNATFDKLSLTPKRLSAFMDVSKSLMIQSSQSAEGLARNDLNRAVRIGVESALINGATGGNNPVGILNTTGIGSVAIGTNGGAPTWAHIVSLWKEIAVDDADVNTLAFLTTPGVAAQLMQTEKASGTAQFVWTTNNREGSMNGYKAVSSTLVPSTLTKGSSSGVCHAILFGDFSSLVIGNWAGIDITVDPYTGAKNALVTLTVNSYWDAVVRHPESFAAVKDALVTI